MQTNQDGVPKLGGNSEKVRTVAEILGLLEETHRGKDWLLQEIKRKHVKASFKSTMNSYEILSACPENFVVNLLRALKGDDVEGFEDVQTLTKTYHWFFTDIVAGSNPTIPTKNQVRKIVVLNELISRTDTFRHKDQTTIILPTGDGMAIGFGDSPEKPLRLAMELHRGLSRYNESRRGKDKLLIRVGIDMGPVYFVKDLNGKDNVWGPGIIMARRVMDAAGDMNILASARIAEDIRKLSPEYKEILHPIGNYSIKHGEELSLYNAYGDGFGNKVASRINKVAKPNMERDIRTVNNFLFNSIEVNLEILKTQTMLTRHRWVWSVTNISKEPKTQMFYYLDGDSPKEFSDMNVSVKDDRGNELQILAVNVNKPYHKEFNVLLNRPVPPKQKKTLILEYDWEEPERTFFYKFASSCKQFKYSCTVPKGVDLKTRILKVDTETGYKVHASPPPTVQNVNGKTLVTWSKNNILPLDAYQFDW